MSEASGSLGTLDLFSGVGGFSLGMEWSGFNVKYAIDNNETTLGTYKRNFPKTEVINWDLSKEETDELISKYEIDTDEIDVVVGGPPCQGFSVMGKGDKNDERNDLLIRYVDYVNEISPDYFLVENVDGLLSSNEHLDKFLTKIESAGYQYVEPIQVLNCAEYGIPQARKRVVILGYKKGLKPPSYPTPDDSSVSAWDALRDLPNDLSEIDNGIYNGKPKEQSVYVNEINKYKKTSQEDVFGISGLDPVDHQQRIRDRFDQVEPGDHDDVSRYYRLKKEEPSTTLRAGSSRDRGTHTAARPIHPVAPRCITVREAARLQSFPDWFQFHETKYHGMRQIGNSVPPLLSKCVGEELKRAVANSVNIQTRA